MAKSNPKAKRIVREHRPVVVTSNVRKDTRANVYFEYDPSSDVLSANFTINDGGRKTRRGRVDINLASIRPFIPHTPQFTAPTGEEYDLEQVGFSFASVMDAASSLVKKVGASKLLEHVQTVMDHPIAQSAMMSVVPELGITYNMAKKVVPLVARVRKGDPNAANALRRVAALASSGDRDARKVVLAATVLNRAIDAKEATTGQSCPVAPTGDPDTDGEVIAGWLYNKPYRSNLARAIDKRDPGNIVRYLYNKGIEDYR